MTNWKGRMWFFVPATANTAQNRQTFAAAFVDNGSMESLENESLLFDNAWRLSLTGSAPVQAYGISTLVTPAIWNALQPLIEAIPQYLLYVAANDDVTYQGTPYSKGELVLTSRTGALGDRVGTQFDSSDVWADVTGTLGYQVIETSI